jgi:hypothetical protein
MTRHDERTDTSSGLPRKAVIFKHPTASRQQRHLDLRNVRTDIAEMSLFLEAGGGCFSTLNARIRVALGGHLSHRHTFETLFHLSTTSQQYPHSHVILLPNRIIRRPWHPITLCITSEQILTRLD